MTLPGNAPLTGGLIDAPVDAARIFRAALDAMARPGQVQTIGAVSAPAPLSPAAAALALTLFDPDTPVWLAPWADTQDIRAWLGFHTGAPIAPRAAASFAIARWEDVADTEDFSIGTSEYPDRSATLIIEVAELGTAHRLTGPGIRDAARLTTPDPAWHQRNRALFPLGIDLFLTCGAALAGVPRTTCVEG